MQPYPGVPVEIMRILAIFGYPLDSIPADGYGCPMGAKMTVTPRQVVSAIVVVALTLALCLAVVNRQIIKDDIAGARFTPTEEIETLTRSLELSAAGDRIFNATQPSLDGSQRFNEQCAAVHKSELGHVLGCYIEDRIYLFEVTDERVSGIVLVTAAHELLHAAYSRLRPGDRALLGEQLRDYYDERSKTDADLKKRMAMYSGLSEANFANELHSVLGSEVDGLPRWLEDHYSNYLRHRSVTTNAYENYRAIFQGLKDDAAQLQQELKDLREDVEARKETYQADFVAYKDDLDTFKARKKTREFTRQPDLKASIQINLDTRKVDLDQRLETLQADVARYNEMRADLKSIGELSKELGDNLDSSLAPR